MRNIHILPTKNASRLYLDSNGELQLRYNLSIKDDYLGSNQHLYITNDERIELGDWFYDDDGELFKYTSTYVIDPNTWKDNKKIVLTTDQDLINDGVQPITNTFAEWFVENPGCKEVEVQSRHNFYVGQDLTHYKIIIPKEEITSKINLVEIPQEQLEKERNPNYEYFSIDEPKTNLDRLPFPELVEDLAKHYEKEPIIEEETLEEAAKKYATNHGMMAYMSTEKEESFIEGAKWQEERMYSEEQVIELIQFLSMDKDFNGYGSVYKETASYFLEKFKKQ